MCVVYEIIKTLCRISEVGLFFKKMVEKENLIKVRIK